MKKIGTGTFKVTHEIQSNVQQVLQSGQLSYGKFSQRFEQDFARLHGRSYGVLSNSGTSSLLVALQALKEYYGWKDGDHVIVPAVTFVATVNVVLQAKLTPVLVDVEPDFYCIDVDRLAEEMAANYRARCVIPVHAFGQPAAMGEIAELARQNNISVVEDSCESMGVTHLDKTVGSWGEIACFSTYMAHLITTGVGGIAITQREPLAKLMRSLVNHGLMYKDLSDDGTYLPVKIHRDFVFERVGHSFRITELEAAIGCAQLETLDDIITKRQSNADYLSQRLWDLPLQLPRERKYTEHAYMMYPIVVVSGNRDDLTKYLNEHEIETRRMLPLVNQPVYKSLWDAKNYPVAQWIDANGFYVGIHQNLTKNDLDYIGDTIRKYYTKNT